MGAVCQGKYEFLFSVPAVFPGRHREEEPVLSAISDDTFHLQSYREWRELLALRGATIADTWPISYQLSDS
jgi:hypothetical protein